MKRYLTGILVFAASHFAIAQDCLCPAGINNDNEGKPHATFRFGNSSELGICGYQTIDLSDTTYTQFTLYNCGDGNIIKEWGASQTCKLKKTKDTLEVMDIYELPVGREFGNIPRPFLIHKFFFKSGSLKEIQRFNTSYGKYTKQQVAQVFTEYGALTKSSNEEIIHVANMLFWAYISGSNEAEKDLLSIPEKFGPFEDATISQEWNDIFAIYQHWKSKNK